MHGRRVTLVGGAGFIGHHLALALAQKGARVSIVDGLQVNNLLAFASADHDVRNQSLNLRVISERLELLKEAGVPLYVMDARDEQALAKRLEQLRPQVLVHLAGVAHAQQSNIDPRSAFEHTLRTLQYSLECVRGSIEHFIFFSSSMVYGNFTSDSVSEDSPCRPVGVYGALKYSGEKMVIAHHQVFDVPYTIVRPSALYGPRCVSRRVVQVFLENALRDHPFVVHGDGSDRLDFTYIADLVDGILGIIRHKAARNETFNLTYGGSRSINELIGLLQADFPNIEVVHKPRGKLVPERGTLCVDKARSLIGYRPRRTLEDGIAAYLQWYRSLSRPGPVWTGHEAEPVETALELSVPSPA
ncbi:MAG: NAD-dependent epimerase/dehydratase family protein [Planctomycetota bacterium]